MFLSSFGFQGSTQKKVVVVLELRDREEFGETKPALVLMLENGQLDLVGYGRSETGVQPTPVNH